MQQSKPGGTQTFVKTAQKMGDPDDRQQMLSHLNLHENTSSQSDDHEDNHLDLNEKDKFGGGLAHNIMNQNGKSKSQQQISAAIIKKI